MNRKIGIILVVFFIAWTAAAYAMGGPFENCLTFSGTDTEFELKLSRELRRTLRTSLPSNPKAEQLGIEIWPRLDGTHHKPVSADDRKQYCRSLDLAAQVSRHQDRLQEIENLLFAVDLSSEPSIGVRSPTTAVFRIRPESNDEEIVDSAFERTLRNFSSGGKRLEAPSQPARPVIFCPDAGTPVTEDQHIREETRPASSVDRSNETDPP